MMVQKVAGRSNEGILATTSRCPHIVLDAQERSAGVERYPRILTRGAGGFVLLVRFDPMDLVLEAISAHEDSAFLSALRF